MVEVTEKNISLREAVIMKAKEIQLSRTMCYGTKIHLQIMHFGTWSIKPLKKEDS